MRNQPDKWRKHEVRVQEIRPHFIGYRIRDHSAQAQQLAAAELRAKLAQAQLQNLRRQLEPHFLFNTLNTISAVMYEDLGAADAMLQQLSNLLRLTLRAANSQEIPVARQLCVCCL